MRHYSARLNWTVSQTGALEAQDEAKASFDAFHQMATEFARRFGEEVAINSHDLRHVDDRVLWQARSFRRNQDVARGINKPKV